MQSALLWRRETLRSLRKKSGTKSNECGRQRKEKRKDQWISAAMVRYNICEWELMRMVFKRCRRSERWAKFYHTESGALEQVVYGKTKHDRQSTSSQAKMSI